MFSFISARLSLRDDTMALGPVSRAAMVRNMLRVTAITSDAGTPLPLTSPMQNTSRLLRMKKSYRSPPTSFAGTMLAAISSSCRSVMAEETLGIIAIWIPLAIWSSFSNRRWFSLSWLYLCWLLNRERRMKTSISMPSSCSSFTILLMRRMPP